MKKIMYLLRNEELMNDYRYMIKYGNTWYHLRYDGNNRCFWLQDNSKLMFYEVSVYSIPEDIK